MRNITLTPDNALWQEVAPGGLMGKVREAWDGAGVNYICLSEKNNGQELTITSDDLPFVIEWLRLVQKSPEPV